MARDIVVSDAITIRMGELQWSFVRSSGPGGQNVNKVNTRAQLTFDLESCDELRPAVKQRTAQAAGRRLTKRDQIIIESDRVREQAPYG